MSTEPTATAEPTEEDASQPEQDWGKVAFCVVLAMIAALGVHYVAFEIVFTSMNLSPTVHALVGMILFFIAGFASFSVFY